MSNFELLELELFLSVPLRAFYCTEESIGSPNYYSKG